MDNPNNPYAYYPPPGYPPPSQPPPEKGLLTAPAGKNSSLALAMVCVMALTTLVSTLLFYLNGADIIDTILANPVNIVLEALCLLLALLVYLKFLLPGWEPHRKALTWLLGVTLLCTLGSSVYGLIQGLQIGMAAMGESDIFGTDPTMAGMAGVVRGITLAASIFGVLASFVMRPFFVLFIGVAAKKSTEKVAGVVSAVSLGLGVLMIPVSMLLGSLTAGEFALPDNLLTSTVPTLISNVCALVFYFTWPVLERPVLGKTA